MADEQNGNRKRLAVLIDGDNAQPMLLKEMLVEASKYGRITIRRIYGDWTTSTMNGWKDSLQESAIQPVQQFRNTGAKNATDSAMIIDAMDILHSHVVDGYCLATSDSDYTRLAIRLKESGAFVMGLGREKTPKSLKSACDVFVLTENLAPQPEPVLEEKAQTKPPEPLPAKAPVNDALPLLRRAFDLTAQEDGWAFLGAIGSALRTLDSSFDHRTFGCANLRALVSTFPDAIQLREAKNASGNSSIFMRFKQAA